MAQQKMGEKVYSISKAYSKTCYVTPSEQESLGMHIYIYLYIYLHIAIYIYCKAKQCYHIYIYCDICDHPAGEYFRDPTQLEVMLHISIHPDARISPMQKHKKHDPQVRPPTSLA